MMSRHALYTTLTLPVLAFGLVASCSGSGGTGGSAGGAASASSSGGGGEGGGFNTDGGSGAVCEPPDVLVLLDRTLTMHRTPEGNIPMDVPDYKTSKWYQAIAAVEELAAPPLDKGVRFGLALWPRDPGEGKCVTLAERVLGKQATNPICESAEIVVPPAVGSGAAIQEYLDPAATHLCASTPMGKAMTSGIDYLKGIAVPGREQYIVLVTDGADWETCGEDPRPIVQAAAAAGIKTYVVGFSAAGDIQPGGVGGEFLNDMACAGGTAKGFPAPCAESAGGWTATDPKGAPLYLKAGNAVELGLALKAIGGKLCCNCADSCDPPEFLFALDRTLTMHKTPDGNTPADVPDYKTSKWHQAITAIEKTVAPPRDQTLRFGLELWPRDPGGGQCVTLAERVQMTKPPTNDACQDGEVVVPPKLGAGAEIQNYLDPATTLICGSTPTGKGLVTAASHLLQNAVPGRDQYVVLVTDGADWEKTCPDPNPLPIVQDLAAGGIRTFVVGFSAEGDIQQGAVGAGFLNDLACAGQTAQGFPANCKYTGTGYVAADAGGPLLYIKAGNASELDSALQGVTGGFCCDCIK
jgi:Mg-chelatase subunit ChlD